MYKTLQAIQLAGTVAGLIIAIKDKKRNQSRVNEAFLRGVRRGFNLRGDK